MGFENFRRDFAIFRFVIPSLRGGLLGLMCDIINLYNAFGGDLIEVQTDQTLKLRNVFRTFAIIKTNINSFSLTIIHNPPV